MLLLSYAALVISLASMGYQVILNVGNATTKKYVRELVSQINAAISSKRISLNKIISMLSAKSTTQLSTYLMSNPAISKSVTEIEADTKAIQEIMSQQSALEAEIANLTNELNSLGYTSSHKGVVQEEQARLAAEEALREKEREYSQLEEKASRLNLSANREMVVNTDHVDALNQNITGGLK